MGCLLQIIGKSNFKVETFEIGWKMKPVSIIRKGDISKRFKQPIRNSRLTFLISDEDNIDAQIKEAIIFLKKQHKYLNKMRGTGMIKSIDLSFCFDSRIDLKNVQVQNDYFPAKLIQLAGEHRLGIALMQWPSKNLYKKK